MQPLLAIVTVRSPLLQGVQACRSSKRTEHCTSASSSATAVAWQRRCRQRGAGARRQGDRRSCASAPWRRRCGSAPPDAPGAGPARCNLDFSAIENTAQLRCNDDARLKCSYDPSFCPHRLAFPGLTPAMQALFFFYSHCFRNLSHLGIPHALRCMRSTIGHTNSGMLSQDQCASQSEQAPRGQRAADLGRADGCGTPTGAQPLDQAARKSLNTQ